MIKMKVRHTSASLSTPWQVAVPKSVTGTHRVRKHFATEAEAIAYLNRVELNGFEKADIRVGGTGERHQSLAERWRQSEWASSAEMFQRLYAWTAIGPKGEEAIIGLSMQGIHCPLIDSDRSRIESLREYAAEIGKFSGRPVQLVTFQRVKTLGKPSR